MPEFQLANPLNLPHLDVVKYDMPDAETAILEINSTLDIAICPTCKMPSTLI